MTAGRALDSFAIVAAVVYSAETFTEQNMNNNEYPPTTRRSRQRKTSLITSVGSSTWRWVSMKTGRKTFLGVALLCAAVSAGAKEPRRIDGTSEASFDKSYGRLVQSLPATERRKFALALFSVLFPHGCLTSDAAISLTFLPASPKDMAGIRPCRGVLHGKSSQDITEEANSKASAARSASR